MSKGTPMVGRRFGGWVVLAQAGSDSSGSVSWLCLCDCGVESTVLGYRLRSGRSLSCGCRRAEATAEAKRKDLVGRTFALLTVIRRDGKASGQTVWLCRCACGTETRVLNGNLTRGHTRSCGCVKVEALRARRGEVRTDEPTYRSVHSRLTAQRGRASDYRCVSCPAWAREWSYDHADPDARHEAHPRTGAPMYYSLDLSHYVPRCKACHRDFDRGIGERRHAVTK